MPQQTAETLRSDPRRVVPDDAEGWLNYDHKQVERGVQVLQYFETPKSGPDVTIQQLVQISGVGPYV